MQAVELKSKLLNNYINRDPADSEIWLQVFDVLHDWYLFLVYIKNLDNNSENNADNRAGAQSIANSPQRPSTYQVKDIFMSLNLL